LVTLSAREIFRRSARAKADSPPLLVFQLTQRELRLKKVELRSMQPEEKDLRRRTKEFALQIIRVFSELPKTAEAQVLGKQVLRSGTSVGANYREAYRARSRAEWSEWDERHAR
jgi:hypothetical protein